ncbi:FAD-dependent oxidoreductase [Scytonema sp. PCC 10023]|uniref:FAD-dependent oxidoreductase n=1 Tax=Scytonema sp. PCC 10023 TaxID=1680591 RepID=UPI0039C74F88
MTIESHQKYKGRVLVIGAGVSGLVTSLCLQRNGFKVTLVASNFAPEITSVVAAALWQWPPPALGKDDHDQTLLTRSKKWCMASYDYFANLASSPETGVFMRPVVVYFKHLVKDNPSDRSRMNELQDKVHHFVHTPALITENQINTEIGLLDAYSHLAPMIDMDVYMGWLLKEVQQADGQVLTRKISGNLKDEEEKLKKDFGVDVIVNCAGLGAIELTNEDMYPLRGAWIRVYNDGKTIPRITKAHWLSHDESSDKDMIYIVPKGDNILLLGGLVEPDKWDLNIGLENYDPVRDMLRRCVEFMPALKDAQIDFNEPVRVGLRPFRRQNVRLEREQDTSIIHNYGHGGAGVTLSWGCAMDVVEIAKELVQQRLKCSIV